MNITENPAIKCLVSTVQELSLARDLETVMKIVRTSARRLTGAEGATFVLKDKDLCFYADEDAISPLWKGSRFPMTSCVSGWAMINRKPAIIEDIYSDPRVPVDAYSPTFVKSLVMVPIRTIDPIGAIGNYWATKHKPTDEEVALLQSLADITAVTLENVKVYTELEERVKERTLDLESVNHELEAFSYSVSHDLRAPLRSIIGYSQILKEDNIDKLDAEGQKTLNGVIKNANRMNLLIEDLLKFSKSTRINLEKSDVKMDNLVQLLVKELNNSIVHKAKISIRSKLPDAFCDVSMVRQIWLNLLSNAVKYSSKTENPEIEIGSYRNENETVYYVKDNGAGFNMDYAGKLFEVFQRLHKNSDFEGTGVGLSLARRIVQKHGGKIWAEGKVNEGATFYFSLPDVSSTTF